MTKRRVVVTGVGFVSPLGVGNDSVWKMLMEGKTGIGPITKFDASNFPSRIAGEVKNFDPLDFMSKQEVRKNDLFVQYALAAATVALEDAGINFSKVDLTKVATIIGSGIGGLPLIEKMHSILVNKGIKRVSPFFIPGLIVNMAAGQVAIKYGFQGPLLAPCTACATGMHAVGEAYWLIRDGFADIAVCGGSEAVVTPLAVAGFSAMKALSTCNDHPEKASRPWDKKRDGFVIAEGSGILVLEEATFAKERGASIYAEIVGFGMSADAYHISAPHPDGKGAILAMERSMKDASIKATEVDYINAHATSTPLGDMIELKAIKQVFAQKEGLMVSSTKGAVGHMLGAAGGFEGGVIALAIRNQEIPPTANLEDPDETYGIDLVPKVGKKSPIAYAMSNSFGFGGTNASLIMRRWENEDEG